MDKLQAWLQRIQQPPRREVANLDYWALLTETRIAQEADMPAESAFEGCERQGKGTRKRREAS